MPPAYKYRISLGLRTSQGFTWDEAARLQFATNCLSEGDMVAWIKGTAIIHTNDPDSILDCMLDHEYSVESVLRWINVGKSEVTINE